MTAIAEQQTAVLCDVSPMTVPLASALQKQANDPDHTLLFPVRRLRLEAKNAEAQLRSGESLMVAPIGKGTNATLHMGEQVNKFFDNKISSEDLRSFFEYHSLYYGSLHTGRDNCEADLIHFVSYCLDHHLRLQMRGKYHYQTMLVGVQKAFRTNIAKDVRYCFLLRFFDKLFPKGEVHSTCINLLEKAEKGVISTLKHLYGPSEVGAASLDDKMKIRDHMRVFSLSPLLQDRVTNAHIFTELLLQESQSSVHNMKAADPHFPLSKETMFNMDLMKMKYKMGLRGLVLKDLNYAFHEGQLEANGSLDYLISIGLALVNGFLYKKMPRGVEYNFGNLFALIESEKDNHASQVEKCNLIQLKAQFPKSTIPSIAMSGFKTMSIKDDPS